MLAGGLLASWLTGKLGGWLPACLLACLADLPAGQLVVEL